MTPGAALGGLALAGGALWAFTRGKGTPAVADKPSAGGGQAQTLPGGGQSSAGYGPGINLGNGAPAQSYTTTDLQTALASALDSAGMFAGNGKPLATDGKLGPLTCGAANWYTSRAGIDVTDPLGEAIAKLAGTCGTGTAPVPMPGVTSDAISRILEAHKANPPHCGEAVSAFTALSSSQMADMIAHYPGDLDWVEQCVMSSVPPAPSAGLQGLFDLATGGSATCQQIAEYLVGMSSADFVSIPTDWWVWYGQSGCQ